MSRRGLWCIALMLALSVVGRADSVIWGNNATFGNVTLEAFDGNTGALLQQFLAPNPQARADNGRGIAAASDGTIYYTTANSGNVYKTNATTHADLGIAFNTGFNGIASITFDGANLFLVPYNGQNNAYEYDTSGNLLKVINGFGNNRDGYEIITRNNQTEIIANRGDAVGPYDLYDFDGNLLQSAFIAPTFSPTGITYDGTSFFVSSIYTNAIAVYDNNGAFVRSMTLGGPLPPTSSGRLIEDLSVLGNTINNPPPNAVPEPSSYILLGSTIAILAMAYKKRMKRAAI